MTDNTVAAAMRLVCVENLAEGAELARDVWAGSAAIPLLRAGTRITAEYLRGLRRAGVGAVYIEDELSEGVEPVEVIREETRSRAAQAVERALQTVALQRDQACGQAALGEVQKAVDLIVDEIASVPEAVLALVDLTTADGYTVQHSIDVTVLGLLLARALLDGEGPWERPLPRATSPARAMEERMRRLGLGLMLHDVGKALLPRPLLVKPGSLTEEEWALIRRHPLVGAEILEASGVGPLALTVVRWHHERLDGSGYPDGLDRESLPLLPRIAAVADVFDAITSARPYRPPRPSWVGVREIVSGEGTLYDPAVVAAFRRTVAPFPVGTLVQLSDGRRGLVATLPPGRPERPVVRLLPDPQGSVGGPVELALLDHPDLDIVGEDRSTLALGWGSA